MSLTSANSVLMIGVAGLYTVPQQLQGFAEGDMYDMDTIDNAEVVMGADGFMSSGWIPQIKTMNVMLQADSASNSFFEAWYAAEEAAREIYNAFATISQPGVKRSYALTNGVLVGYSPMASAKKILQPRKFSIKWNYVVGVPV
jgi:hypothetical protein